jgi:uncharacterized protein
MKPDKSERIQFATEIRAITAEGGQLRKIVGRPAVFNALSEDLGGFREIIKPGAFKKTLSERNVKSLWNHDSNYVLGSVKSGTLSVREDEEGLFFEATPPDATWARDMMVSIDRGDVDQMSFGFRTINDEWAFQTIDGEEILIRMLLECELYEVSPVTFPAYPDTSVGLRSVSLRDRFGTDDRATIAAAIAASAGNPADTTRASKPDGNTEPPLVAPGSDDGKHSAARGKEEDPDYAAQRRIDEIRASLAKEGVTK